jgi:hypothetical protein
MNDTGINHTRPTKRAFVSRLVLLMVAVVTFGNTTADGSSVAD